MQILAQNAGVSTAVLLFTKGGTTEKIWFYDMEHDGYSLDDKRQRVPDAVGGTHGRVPRGKRAFDPSEWRNRPA